MDRITKLNLGKLSHWGVDVKDEESSLIRRGLVCDLLDRGLVVDFLHPAHRADFVPFGNLVRPADLETVRIGSPTEALFQRSTDQPFYWHPVRLLAPDNSDSGYAFVESGSGDERVEMVVPSRSVRKSCMVMLSGNSSDF